jgi:hypothetical protein
MFSYEELHAVCMKIFEQVAIPVSWFVLPLFLIRVSYAQLSGDSSEIRSAIKGVILYFTLIASFGLVLELLLQIPRNFIPEVSAKDVAAKVDALAKQEKSALDFYLKMGPEVLTLILESILSIIYWSVLILHVLVMIIITAMAPIVFLLGCVLNVGVPLRLFFGLIITASCWPVIWYGFDQAIPFIEKVIPDQFGRIILEVLMTAFKGIGPLTIAYMSLNSGVGKAAVATVSTTVGSAGKGAKAAAGLASYATRGSFPKAFSARTKNGTSTEALNNFKGENNNPGGFSSFSRTAENMGLDLGSRSGLGSELGLSEGHNTLSSIGSASSLRRSEGNSGASVNSGNSRNGSSRIFGAKGFNQSPKQSSVLGPNSIGNSGNKITETGLSSANMVQPAKNAGFGSRNFARSNPIANQALGIRKDRPEIRDSGSDKGSETRQSSSISSNDSIANQNFSLKQNLRKRDLSGSGDQV